MKKLLIMAAAIIFSSSAAAEVWKMAGVMAVYPGTVNEPFSAPIVNDKEYASETDCKGEINDIANAHPILVMINNGNQLPPEKPKAATWQLQRLALNSNQHGPAMRRQG